MQLHCWKQHLLKSWKQHFRFLSKVLASKLYQCTRKLRIMPKWEICSRMDCLKFLRMIRWKKGSNKESSVANLYIERSSASEWVNERECNASNYRSRNSAAVGWSQQVQCSESLLWCISFLLKLNSKCYWKFKSVSLDLLVSMFR